MNIYLKLLDMGSVFSCIQPGDNDEYRFIWLEVERGPIEILTVNRLMHFMNGSRVAG